jgi:hypothetical protein
LVVFPPLSSELARIIIRVDTCTVEQAKDDKSEAIQAKSSLGWSSYPPPYEIVVGIKSKVADTVRKALGATN